MWLYMDTACVCDHLCVCVRVLYVYLCLCACTYLSVCARLCVCGVEWFNRVRYNSLGVTDAVMWVCYVYAQFGLCVCDMHSGEIVCVQNMFVYEGSELSISNIRKPVFPIDSRLMVQIPIHSLSWRGMAQRSSKKWLH